LDTLSLDQGPDQGNGPAPGGDISAKDDSGGRQPDAKKPDDTGDRPSDKPPDPKLDDKNPDAGDQSGDETTRTRESESSTAKEPPPTSDRPTTTKESPPLTTTGEPPTTSSPPPPDEEEEPGQCGENSDDEDCGAGWPWWPWLGAPPEPDDSDGRGQGEVPAGRPQAPPAMQLPEPLPEDIPKEPAVIDVQPGVGVAAADVSLAPVTLPVIVAPSIGIPAGTGAPRSLPPEPVRGAPRGSAAERPSARGPAAAEAGNNVSAPNASYRVGYTEYLRNAGLSQVVAVALPGLAGIVVLTGAGGLVGYRQAKAGHAVRTGGTARFVN
jgi:hypothetical protein